MLDIGGKRGVGRGTVTGAGSGAVGRASGRR